MKTKQAIIIRRDLKMRRGKEIAQGAHASISFLSRRLQDGFVPVWKDPEIEWLDGSFTKITLKVNSKEEIEELHLKALAAGVESHMITDNGTTEFKGIPTITALAIGPDYNEKIDSITSELELY